MPEITERIMYGEKWRFHQRVETRVGRAGGDWMEREEKKWERRSAQGGVEWQ